MCILKNWRCRSLPSTLPALLFCRWSSAYILIHTRYLEACSRCHRGPPRSRRCTSRHPTCSPGRSFDIPWYPSEQNSYQRYSCLTLFLYRRPLSACRLTFGFWTRSSAHSSLISWAVRPCTCMSIWLTGLSSAAHHRSWLRIIVPTFLVYRRGRSRPCIRT